MGVFRSGKHSNDRLQGTLDLIVLKTLASRGQMHGYAITLHIATLTDSVLQVQEGSLYPALHRMTQVGWLRSAWGSSDNGRRARFYEITAIGRQQLTREEESWAQLTGAVARLLEHA